MISKSGCKCTSSLEDTVKIVIFDYKSPCCDLDIEDSEPIFLRDTSPHDYTPPYQFWLKMVERFRRYWTDTIEHANRTTEAHMDRRTKWFQYTPLPTPHPSSIYTGSMQSLTALCQIVPEKNLVLKALSGHIIKTQITSLKHVQNKKSECSDNSHSSANTKIVIVTSHTKHTVLNLLNVCSNHWLLTYGGEDSKTICSLWLTYLWPQIRQRSSNVV